MPQVDISIVRLLFREFQLVLLPCIDFSLYKLILLFVFGIMSKYLKGQGLDFGMSEEGDGKKINEFLLTNHGQNNDFSIHSSSKFFSNTEVP